MLAIRRAKERGHANHGWLDSYHTFSFADYHDPAHMGFRSLRVINEDVIAPAQGFGTHPHRDMEILTYLIEGELAHKDSMGNGRIIKTGEVQGMSAGTGVAHSEFNALRDKPAHLLQIWIVPHTKNVQPAYGEWVPARDEKTGWALAASEKGEGGSIQIYQDVRFYIATSEKEKTLPLPIAKNRFGWIQIAKGKATIAGNVLEAGDGAAFSGTDADELTFGSQSQILLFDLA